MASIMAVSSFFILLLVTFSYSAPVGQEYENPQTSYDYTTDQTFVQREHPVDMRLLSDDESTDVPTFKNQSSEEYHNHEFMSDYVTHSSRSYEPYSYPSSTETYEKPSVEDFLYTTLESSTQFNARAIRPVESQEEYESSTSLDWKNQMEMTTNVEPTSSVDSFGQYTGLLNSETTSMSDYSTTEWPVKYQQPPKVVSILPGQFTKTKVYTSVPRKPSVFVQPSPQEQLSEVQDQSIIETTKSYN